MLHLLNHTLYHMKLRKNNEQDYITVSYPYCEFGGILLQCDTYLTSFKCALGTNS